MIRFVVERMIAGLLTLSVVSVLAFLIIQLPPGDYIESYIAQLSIGGTGISKQEVAALRESYGLDQPVLIQYLRWITRVMAGDFGMSMEWGRPVREMLQERLGLTIAVSLAAVLFTWLVALPIGIYSAVHPYSSVDNLLTFVGFLGLAVPGFLLALIALYLGYQVFDVQLGGLFSTQYERAPWSSGKALDLLKHLWLPALILGASGIAAQMRLMRANLLDELRRPYVVTARAKGLREFDVIMKYPVRAALNPFASTIGYLLPTIVSGSIIVSLVLSLPTVGQLLLGALLSQDMYLAGGIVLMLGLLTVVGTFSSDLLLMWIEPRLRLAGS